MDDPLPHDERSPDAADRVGGVDLLGELLELAEQLGVQVRRASMGGSGGGLATLRGQPILFVDTDAPAEVQLEKSAAGLSRLADRIEQIYVRPALRALLEGGQ